MKTLNRSKLNYKMRKLQQANVTFACAPSGFGKTTAFHSYLDHQDNDKLWYSMYEQQDEVWAWSRLVKELHEYYPMSNLPTAIPTSRKAVDLFLEALLPHIKKPLYIILDDTLLNSIPNILKAIAIISYVPLSQLHVIILTKEMNEETLSLPFSNATLLLHTTDFAFSRDEITYLCHLEQLPVNEQQMDTLYAYTNGWAIAVSLMLEGYKTNANFYYQGTLDQLISRVLFDALPVSIQESFMKLSILKSFTLPFAYELCEDHEAIQKLVQLEKENHFIQTIRHGTYQYIPVFKEFLAKRLLTSGIDMKNLTLQAGACYISTHEPIEAIEILLKVHAYDAIFDIFAKFPEIDFADIAPELMINVFQSLPDHYKNEQPLIYLKWIIDCITNFSQFNGALILEDFKKRIDAGLIKEDKEQMLGEYYFIHAFLSFNHVEAMMEDFIRAHAYFHGQCSRFAYPFMIASFGCCHMLFLYYNTIGKLKKTVEYIEKNIHYFIEISGGINTGSNLLVRAEYLYETGTYKEVDPYVTLAYNNAMEKSQLSVAICCLFLKGRLYLMQHATQEYRQVLEQLNSFYEKSNSPILHYELDCALGYLYILNDTFSLVPSWLAQGNFEDQYILPEAMIMALIVHGLCLIKKQQYIKLKQLADQIDAHNSTVIFVFAKIYASLFRTIYIYKTGEAKAALVAFKNCVELCSEDGVISPIVELSFAFDHLLESFIPDTIFETALLHCVKKHLHLIQKSDDRAKPLTPKEKEVFRLYAQGEKIKDIAEKFHISINTVQSHMKSIYKKLNISTKTEAAQYYKNNFR